MEVTLSNTEVVVSPMRDHRYVFSSVCVGTNKVSHCSEQNSILTVLEVPSCLYSKHFHMVTLIPETSERSTGFPKTHHD